MPCPQQALAQDLSPSVPQALTDCPASSVPSAPPVAEGTMGVWRQGWILSGEALEASFGQAFIPEGRAGFVQDVIYMSEARSFFLIFDRWTGHL